MNYQIGYGKGGQVFEIPEKNKVTYLMPNSSKGCIIGKNPVEAALSHPIGSPILESMVRAYQRIVIVTSDITRPMPTKKVLPVLLEHLQRAGITREQITVVFALGSHRRHTEEEKRSLVGDEIYGRIRLRDSSEDEFVYMGMTPAGTPVEIAKTVAEADFRICMGNIEYHYFAGYSGGAKAIMPGVSTRKAIQANHAKMVERGAVVGAIDGNPVREDIEEAVKICPIDFLLNVVLNEKKEIVYAVAGHYKEAHRAGCRFLDRLYKVKIKERADIVIASPGGYPKDLNLYQTQKALANAQFAVKDDGIIILAGSCEEGMGEKVFEEWMQEAKTPGELIRRIQEEFRLGGHKAAAIAMVLERAAIYLVSEMDADFVRSIFMRPYRTVQGALEDALVQKGGQRASIIFMPYAGSMLPVIA
ncbi:MAG: nickel-dependent lactate racemase [Coprococcus sp.]|nr:nickel-dependent lactate racemase [Coprococcus sp.]